MSEIATNRKAGRDYHILEKYEAGIELKGTEVFLWNCHIKPYEKASHEQHEPMRSRRLLLHKNEIMKLWASSQQKHLAIVPLRAYWKNSRVKIEIGVGKGKTKGDQREDLKKKVENREAQREMARFNEKHR